ncbi:MAG: lactate utilization protein [Parcubacteria group bacterium]
MENSNWSQLSTDEVVQKTLDALKERNIEAEVVEDKGATLKKIQTLIPDSASVMTGASTTLDEIGFTDLLKSGSHPWKNFKDEMLAEKDEKLQNELRKRSVLADYYLGSVHAVTEGGKILIASATGSQLPASAFTSNHVIFVVGAQKIVKDFEGALRRLNEYVFPLEDARMKSVGYPGSVIGKILILEKEYVPGRIKLIFVKEKLGF